MKRELRDIVRVAGMGLAILLLVLGIYSPYAWAVDREQEYQQEAGTAKGAAKAVVVRVAITDSGDFMKKGEDGVISGYAAEYLTALTQETGWQLQYVEGSYSEAYKRLKIGEVDLIAGVDRQQDLLYSKVPMIYGSYAICIPKTSGISPFEGIKLEGIRIGYVEGNGAYDVLTAYLKQKQVEAVLVPYPNYAALHQALKEKKTAVAVMEDYQVNQEEAIADSMDYQGFYYGGAKDNAKLIRELDLAQEKLLTAQPDLEQQLYQKYYGGQSRTYAYTKAENAYMVKSKSIKVAVAMNQLPFSSQKEGEEPKGITIELLNLLSNQTGLTFTIVPAENLNEAARMVYHQEADCMAGILNGYLWANNYAMDLTVPYMSLPMHQAVHKELKENGAMKAAFPKDLRDDTSKVIQTQAYSQIQYLDSIQDCLDQVEQGKVAVTYTDWYTYLANPAGYPNVEILPDAYSSNAVCLGVRSTMPPELTGILNKGIQAIRGERMQQMIQAEWGGDSDISPYQMLLRKLGNRVIDVLAVLAVIVLLLVYAREKKKRKKLRYQNIHDPLTGTYRYDAFLKEARKQLKKNSHSEYLMCGLDIDKFQYINHSFGYPAGNEVLKLVGKTIEASLEADEICTRVTADQFILLLRYTTVQAFRERMSQMDKQIAAKQEEKGSSYTLVLAMGAYLMKRGDTDISGMVDKANIARKSMKGGHASSFSIFSEEMEQKLTKDKEIENAMFPAFHNHEFQVYLQPKVDLLTSEWLEAEALVRWEWPGHGFIGPGDFIPVFERNGFIVYLDFYVYEEICKLIRRWLDEGRKVVPISLNVSPAHLGEGQFLQRVQSIMDKYQVPMEYVEFELLEKSTETGNEDLKKMVTTLKQEGYRVAIDDFGTGYSSLSLLRDIPVDVVKLDRYFLSNKKLEMEDKVIISNVIRMAKELGIQVIGEGIETQEQARFLFSAGCDLGQGYLFGKPMSIEEFEKKL